MKRRHIAPHVQAALRDTPVEFAAAESGG